jgi:hypothetical protein
MLILCGEPVIKNKKVVSLRFWGLAECRGLCTEAFPRLIGILSGIFSEEL